MLTGLIKIEDARYFSVVGHMGNFSVKAAAPVLEPTGTAALLSLNVGASIALANGQSLQAGGQVSGHQVWAAQWQRVDTKFIPEKDWDGKMLPTMLRLTHIVSVGVKRGSGTAIANFSLREATPYEVDTSSELPKEYWKRFEEEIDLLDEDEED